MNLEKKKAKKLGEVLAFARVAEDTINKGRVGLEKVWDDSKLNSLLEENKKHAEELERSINGLSQSEAGLNKAEATGEKLTSMRNMYIGDEWDDPMEMFEWLGFFQGAAAVHWSLIVGFAEKEEEDELKELANKGEFFHRKVLDDVMNSIKSSVNN